MCEDSDASTYLLQPPFPGVLPPLLRAASRNNFMVAIGSGGCSVSRQNKGEIDVEGGLFPSGLYQHEKFEVKWNLFE